MSSPTAPARWLMGVTALALTVFGECAWACLKTGDPAPAVVTLMASKTNPETDAWIIRPDCTFTEILNSADRLVMPGSDVERVASLPSKTEVFVQYPHKLSSGADFSSAKELTTINLQKFSTKLLDNLVFPPTVPTLFLAYTSLTSIKAVTFPKSIDKLYLRGNSLTSLKDIKFPAALQELYLDGNKLTSIDLVFPAKLTSLELTNNPITLLERVTFSSPLETLYLDSCGLTAIRGVTWPATLRDLSFNDNPITSLEIRQSDVALFSKLNALQGPIEQTKCADKTAVLVTIKSKSICVITDERFATQYGSQAVSPTSAPTDNKTSSPANKGESSGADNGGDAGETGNKGGGSGSSGGVTGDGGSRNSTTTKLSSSSGSGPSKKPLNLDSDGDIIDPLQRSEMGSVAGAESIRKTRSPGKSAGSADGTVVDSVPAPSTSTTVVIISSSAGGVLVLVGLVLICRKRRMVKNPNEDPYAEGKTPSAPNTNSDPSAEPSQEYVPNDVRNDRLLLGFRIELKDITVEDEPIARGGYGVIYRGQFLGRDVVMKQMIPGLWRDEGALASFMDEIRLCASLDHARITTFVGIAWSSLRDLSAVIEYMPGGDLHGLLRRHPVPVPHQDWLQPWTSTNIKPKTVIAQDIAEAVVYLHSFNNPILHRDLKAKNVLLDMEGNAKLSDFGISRELSVDETMTREVGTAAWIAPEVLRGERYSEKADIYSLGVVLVEMDRCRHPYADRANVRSDGQGNCGEHQAAGRASISGLAHKNTQIALLVSTGKLRPSVSHGCPEDIALLVQRCLHYTASDRPTAMEVYYELRQIGKQTCTISRSPACFV